MKNMLISLSVVFAASAFGIGGTPEMPDNKSAGGSQTIPEAYITNSHNDYISPDKRGDDVARLINNTERVTRVCRYRSPGGYCWLLSLQVPGGLDQPVPLKREPEFNKWKAEADTKPGWDYCADVPVSYNPWTVVGSAPTACGTHNVTEEATCVTPTEPNACPQSCTTQTRNTTIDNGPCGPAPTLNVTAPASAHVGQDFSVQWTSTNAGSCTSSSNLNSTLTAGSRTMNYPYITTETFTVTCIGNGQTVSDSATTTITSAPVAPTVTVSASKTSVQTGESFTVSWSSTNATSCTSSQIAVSSTSGGRNTSINSAGNRTYTVTCTGTGGTGSDYVTVTAAAATPSPSVSFSINKSSAQTNETFTASWSASNATNCYSGNVPSVGGRTSGSVNMSSSNTGYRTYSVTCSGPGGSGSDSDGITITAPAPPRATVTVNVPSTAVQGTSITGTWSSTNATRCNSPHIYGVAGTSGSGRLIALNVGTHTLRVSCLDSVGWVNGYDTIRITAPSLPAPTVTVNAPSSVNVGQSFQVTWSSTNANNCSSSQIPGVSATSGSATMSYSSAGTRTLRVTCTGSGGTGNGQDTVTVNSPVVHCPAVPNSWSWLPDYYPWQAHGSTITISGRALTQTEFIALHGRSPSGAEVGSFGVLNICATFNVHCNSGTRTYSNMRNRVFCGSGGP